MSDAAAGERAQRAMQALLDELVRDGSELGVQLTAYLRGARVVDAWAGTADPATGRAVDGQTLFPVFSVTKGMTATVIHRLAERGRLRYDMPVAEVWPEFAKHGKGAITVRQVLSHTAGVHLLPAGLTEAQLFDWAGMVKVVADLVPAYPPGERTVYHAMSWGWIVGEVARRVDGRPIGQLIREEVCIPLGIEHDLFVGLPDAEAGRAAMLEEIFAPGAEPAARDDGQPREVPSALLPMHARMNKPQWRRVCLPGSSGIMTARAIAHHYAALLSGGVDGVELLRVNSVREATRRHNPPNDPGASPETRSRGLGYALGGGASEMGTRPSAFGHIGYGGSIGYADPDHGLAVGLTKNRFSPRGATVRMLRALRDALGVPQ